MNERYVDGILAYVDGVMTKEHHEALVAELKYVEAEIARVRMELEKWEEYGHRVRTESHTPADLRQDVLETLQIKRDLLRSGERYRAYIIRELYDQPHYRSAVEYAN